MLQTAKDLLETGYEVIVVVDAVLSQNRQDRHVGLAALRAMGVQLMTLE